MGLFSCDDLIWELEKCKEEIASLNQKLVQRELEICKLKEYIQELKKGDVKDGKEE